MLLLLFLSGLVGVGGQAPPTPSAAPPVPAAAVSAAGGGCADACIGAYNTWYNSLPLTKTFLPLPSSACDTCGKAGSCITSSNASAALFMQPVCSTTDAVLQTCNTGGARVALRSGTDTLLCSPVNSWAFVTIVVVLTAFGAALFGSMTMWCIARRRRAYNERLRMLLQLRKATPKVGQLPSMV